MPNGQDIGGIIAQLGQSFLQMGQRQQQLRQQQEEMEVRRRQEEAAFNLRKSALQQRLDASAMKIANQEVLLKLKDASLELKQAQAELAQQKAQAFPAAEARAEAGEQRAEAASVRAEERQDLEALRTVSATINTRLRALTKSDSKGLLAILDNQQTAADPEKQAEVERLQALQRQLVERMAGGVGLGDLATDKTLLELQKQTVPKTIAPGETAATPRAQVNDVVATGQAELQAQFVSAQERRNQLTGTFKQLTQEGKTQEARETQNEIRALNLEIQNIRASLLRTAGGS
jgi:hypothetical protein